MLGDFLAFLGVVGVLFLRGMTVGMITLIGGEIFMQLIFYVVV